MGQRHRDINEIECDYCSSIIDASDSTICTDCNITLCEDCAKLGFDKESRCKDCDEVHKANYDEQQEGKDANENDEASFL